MKFHPILFSTPMVQAILEGRKTMTRRLVEDPEQYYMDELIDGLWPYKSIGQPAKCRYGKVGDVLWVREEHLITFSEDRKWITVTFKDGTEVCRYYKDFSLKTVKNLYKRKTIGKWQRARFLPKEMARIFLRNTNVRVERLQDITEQDAIAEGIERLPRLHWWKNYLGIHLPGTSSAIESFMSLWDSINGAESRKANPWVWVVEFERIEKPENF